MSDDKSEAIPEKQEVEEVENVREEKPEIDETYRQVDEEPLEYKIPEPPLISIDKVSTILLIGAVCLFFHGLIASLGICHCWLLTFTLWAASSIAFIAISSKKVPIIGKSVLVTGCDTGFGHALALHLEKLGFRVFALCLSDGEGAAALRAVDSNTMHVLIGDVTKQDDLKRARQQLEELLPKGEGLWGVVNNAGIAAFGDVEWVPLSTYKKICEVNVFGTIAVTQMFLPLVRKAKGRIINVASMLGRMALPMWSPYVLSKFAIEGFSDCLRYEMKSWGVSVIVMEPGNFTAGTNLFTDESVEKTAKEMWDAMSEEVRSDYGEELFQKRLRLMKSTIAGGSTDLSMVTTTFVSALTDASPQARYQPMDVYFKTRVFIASHFPEWVYDNIYMRCLNK